MRVNRVTAESTLGELTEPEVVVDLASDEATRVGLVRLGSIAGPRSVRIVGSHYERLRQLHLVGMPLKTIRVTDVVDGSNPAILDFLAFLRDSTGTGVKLLWQHLSQSYPSDSVLASDFYHLFPPTAERPERNAKEHLDWSSSFRYGDLYYRRGPGFVSVIRNTEGRPARYVIDDPVELRVFMGALEPAVVTDLAKGSGEYAALRALQAEGLIAVNSGRCVTLPYRMSRWPIPMLTV